jgi:hypothetical protein
MGRQELRQLHTDAAALSEGLADDERETFAGADDTAVDITGTTTAAARYHVAERYTRGREDPRRARTAAHRARGNAANCDPCRPGQMRGRRRRR